MEAIGNLFQRSALGLMDCKKNLQKVQQGY